MNIINTIIGGVTAAYIGAISFFGLTPTSYFNDLKMMYEAQNDQIKALQSQADVTFGAFNPTGGGTYRLRSSIGTTDATIRLTSFKEPISNIKYTMSYLNTSIAYGTVESQVTNKSEFVSFSGITQNSDGTADLTGAVRGLTRSPAGSLCTASTTLAKSHPGQSTFILSDSPCLFAEYPVKRNDEDINGSWTFIYPTASGSPATKGYVDANVNGGAVSHDATIVAGVAGQTISTGTIVYFSATTTEWMKTSASATSTSLNALLGIAQGTGSDGVAISGGVLIKGIDRTQGTTLTAGQRLFLSNTQGATSTSAGTNARLLGQSRDGDEFYFDPPLYTLNLDIDGSFTQKSTTTLATTTITGSLSVTGTSTLATTTFSNLLPAGGLLLASTSNITAPGIDYEGTKGIGRHGPNTEDVMFNVRIPPRSLNSGMLKITIWNVDQEGGNLCGDNFFQRLYIGTSASGATTSMTILASTTYPFLNDNLKQWDYYTLVGTSTAGIQGWHTAASSTVSGFTGGATTTERWQEGIRAPTFDNNNENWLLLTGAGGTAADCQWEIGNITVQLIR